MAEVFVEFDDVFTGPNDRSYTARVCGRERGDGMWEGWIEFVPLDGSGPVRTGRETTQPNRRDTAYWATGLTFAYLEGALRRVFTPAAVPDTPPRGEPAFDAPAPTGALRRTAAVLDPFQVQAQGEDVLRHQLQALSRPHLRNIALAYRFVDDSSALDGMTEPELIALIMRGVREHEG